jgi:hypothetical protein
LKSKDQDREKAGKLAVFGACPPASERDPVALVPRFDGVFFEKRRLDAKISGFIGYVAKSL